MRLCIDCGSILKNRSLKTKRCRDCYLIDKSKNKTGRTTGYCLTCNKRLSTKSSKTGKCESCFKKTHTPWNKGVIGLVPWNKGKSKFVNEEEYKIHANKLRKKTRKMNHRQVFADRIRTLIRNSFKHLGLRKQNTKTVELLGCDIDSFIHHIEKQFSHGMTWCNYGNGYGKWNIDHILPVSSFELTNKEQAKIAFNYKNCRPMWAIENIKKGSKILTTLAAAVLTYVVTY